MDLIEMTRELGKAIQKDERFANLQAANKANEADSELMEMINRIQLVHMSYQSEAAKEDKNEQKLSAYDEEFQGIYQKVKDNENMQRYESAMEEMDTLMKKITGMLSRCALGDNPDVCDVEAEQQDCADSCDGCSGCN
ncbi:MAG TPA: YlbF family regulator [Clostridia bacterium]|nr:YlbF family regulator [Clostridia bacterium]